MGITSGKASINPYPDSFVVCIPQTVKRSGFAVFSEFHFSIKPRLY